MLNGVLRARRDRNTVPSLDLTLPALKSTKGFKATVSQSSSCKRTHVGWWVRALLLLPEEGVVELVKC